MDQIKIGKFIAECRKNKKITQSQLAEKLGITDRAVSKWETGNGMPDSSIMLELCEILEISVNELLSGEVINMENYNVNVEKNLLEMVKEKENSDKRLLKMEIATGIVTVIPFLVLLGIAAYVEMADWLRIVLIIVGIVPFLTACFFAVGIEQKAGYYECQECHHKYVPTYSSVLFAMHVNRTRYMKCPECGKKSWQKKVISK